MTKKEIKNIRLESGIRLFVWAALWCSVGLPYLPGWTIGGTLAFHVVAAIYVSWCGFLLYLSLAGPEASPKILKYAAYPDAVVLSLLVHFTGGAGASPFVVLMFAVIVAHAWTGNRWRTIGVSVASLACLGCSFLVWEMQLLPTIAMFDPGVGGAAEQGAESIYLLTVVSCLSVLLVTFVTGNLHFAGKKEELADENQELRKRLKVAHKVMENSYHQIEELSAMRMRLADRARNRTGMMRPDDSNHVSH